MKTYFCSTWIITGSWYLNVVTFQHINIWHHWEIQQQCHFDIKLIVAFLRFEYWCYALCTWAYCKFKRKWCTKSENFSTLPCSNCFWVEYRYSLSPLSYTVYHFPYCEWVYKKDIVMYWSSASRDVMSVTASDTFGDLEGLWWCVWCLSSLSYCHVRALYCINL